MKKLLLIATVLFLAACDPTTNDPKADPTTPPITSAKVCGTIAGLTCTDPAEFCFFEDGVCRQISDAQGVCTIKPEACTRDFRPVCGCDGKTYSNRCVAHSAGISVASQGECPTTE